MSVVYGTITETNMGGVVMGDEAGRRSEDALLDLGAKSNEELRGLLEELSAEEQDVSYRRRVLHGKIDILRAELVRRLKSQHDAGDDVIGGRDLSRLVDILAHDLRPSRPE